MQKFGFAEKTPQSKLRGVSGKVKLFRVGKSFSHCFVTANTAAGIAEKAVVLTSTAVVILRRDYELLQRLDAHKSGTLYHVVMDTEPVQQYGKKQRISYQNVVAA